MRVTKLLSTSFQHVEEPGRRLAHESDGAVCVERGALCVLRRGGYVARGAWYVAWCERVWRVMCAPV